MSSSSRGPPSPGSDRGPLTCVDTPGWYARAPTISPLTRGRRDSRLPQRVIPTSRRVYAAVYCVLRYDHSHRVPQQTNTNLDPSSQKEVTRVTSKVAPTKKNKNHDSQLLEVLRLLASCLKSAAIIVSAFF